MEHPPLDRHVGLVRSWLLRQDPDGRRFGGVVRRTFDQLYDGQRTGRFRFEDLHKTEKTHMGTLIEINLQREFGFADGEATDYCIAGIQVDCKYSMKFGGWTLPPEVIGHLAILVTADDAGSCWTAGLIRVQEDLLNPGRNRDAKGTLSSKGREQIEWIWSREMELPPNVFLQLTPAELDRIFSAQSTRAHTSGQARVNELFRVVQGRAIRRSELATVAQQDDFMKRARRNGGARGYLRDEGILVLGHQDAEPLIAEGLGLPRPNKGELVSIRVVPATGADAPAVLIDGCPWRIASDKDPVVAAPLVNPTTVVMCPDLPSPVEQLQMLG